LRASPGLAGIAWLKRSESDATIHGVAVEANNAAALKALLATILWDLQAAGYTGAVCATLDASDAVTIASFVQMGFKPWAS